MNAAELNKNLTAGDWHSLVNRTTKAVVSTAFSNTKIVAEVYGSMADANLMASAPRLAASLRLLLNAALKAGMNDSPYSYAVQDALRALALAGTPLPKPAAPPPPPLSDAAFSTVDQVVSVVRARSFGQAHVRSEVEAAAARSGIYQAYPSMPYGTAVSVCADRGGWLVSWKVGSCE